jgi:hypothetical protein
VAAVNEAFAAGDVKRALALTPDAVADRIMVAGTPDDRIEWLNTAYTPTGMTHALLSLRPSSAARPPSCHASDENPATSEHHLT